MSCCSNSHLGEDILMEILICLPLKSVTRWKCVSKRWNHLISQPWFRICYCDRTRRNIIHHQQPLGIFQTPSFEILPGAKIPLLKFSATPPPQAFCAAAKEEEEEESGDHTRVNIKSLESSQQILNLLGNIICSSDGLFLCGHNNPRTYYVFHPLTRECYRLPPIPRKQRQSIMGLVVDSSSLSSSSIRYKVVSADIGTYSHSNNIYVGETIEMETFSSETCKWRQSTVSVLGSYSRFCWYTSTPSTTITTVIGGAIHWMNHEFNNIGVYHPFKEDNELEMIRPPHSASFFIPCVMGESTDGLLQLAAFDYYSTIIRVWIYHPNKEKENEERVDQHWSMTHEVQVNSITRNFDSRFNIPYFIPLAFHPHKPGALFVTCSGYVFLFHLNTTTPSMEIVQYIHHNRGSSDAYYGEFESQVRHHPYFLPLWPISPHPPSVTKNKGPSIIKQLQDIFHSYASLYYH